MVYVIIFVDDAIALCYDCHNLYFNNNSEEKLNDSEKNTNFVKLCNCFLFQFFSLFLDITKSVNFENNAW